MKLHYALVGLAAAGAAFAALAATSISSSGEFKPVWPLSSRGEASDSAPTEQSRLSSSGHTPEDFLVQMVCDDGAGGHTSQDPVDCPTAARKLRIGESLPYHKYDGTPSSGTQISDSFPVGDISGRFRAVHTFFFTGYSHIPVFDGAAPRSSDPVYDAAAETGMTGYDMSMADGTYVSFMGTYDGSRGWQPLWGNSSCSLADSWVIAPKSAVMPISSGYTITTLQNASPQCPSVTSFAQSATVWNSYGAVYYEGGKYLDTIKSWHFGGPTLDSNAIEVFYFTREYGKTRWEAWRSADTHPEPNPVANARCPNGTDGGYVTFGNTQYTLQDCHDWSFIYPAANGGWDPAANWHVDPVFNSRNLLQNAHLQCTSGGNIADCAPTGGSGNCSALAPWSVLGPLSVSVNEALMGPDQDRPGYARPSANCAIRTLNTTSATTTQSVYQDVVSIPPGHTSYTFGAALWRPVLSNVSGAQTAYITVYQVGAAGVLDVHQIPVNVARKRQIAKSTFTLNPATTWLRFEIYFNTPGLYYEFSDAWIAPAV